MTLKELSAKIAERRKELKAIFDEARTESGDLDFRRVKSVVPHKDMAAEDRAIAVAEKVDELNKELEDLTKRHEKLASAEKALAALGEPQPRLEVDGADGKRDAHTMLWADVAREAARRLVGAKDGATVTIDDFDPRVVLQAVVSTTAGLPPYPEQTSTIVPMPIRPLSVLDAVPAGRMSSNALIYRQQTVRTVGAAERAEGAPLPASAFEWQTVTATAVSIGDSVQVTDEQLEDEPQIADIIEQQLSEHVRLRLDGQIVNGDGVAPNLRGLLNTSGILTRAKQAGEDGIDTLHKAITDVQVGSFFATPTLIVMHPTDWEAIRLLKTADGIYVFGAPSDQVAPRLWGLPVATSLALTAGSAIVGSFTPASIMFHVRRGVTIETGFVNDDFQRKQRTVRADMRGALAVYRPAAFAQVTGL